MEIKFYRISEDPRTVKKTLINTGTGANLQATLTGNIKTDCSIIKPVLEVQYSADVFNSNYVYIAAFNRYYFITDTEVSTQRLKVYLDEDDLMSHYAEIYKLTCVVERQEAKFRSNLYMDDPMFKTIAPKQWVPLPFPKSFDKTGSYVLCVGGAS